MSLGHLCKCPQDAREQTEWEMTDMGAVGAGRWRGRDTASAWLSVPVQPEEVVSVQEGVGE